MPIRFSMEERALIMYAIKILEINVENPRGAAGGFNTLTASHEDEIEDSIRLEIQITNALVLTSYNEGNT